MKETTPEVLDKDLSVSATDAVALPVAVTVSGLLKHVQVVQEAAAKAMHEGQHYGKIPGTDKPTLLKPGAEILGLLFGLAPDFEITTDDLGNGHREVKVKCILRTRSGTAVGAGVGSCSTLEAKYRWRSASLKCPNCGKESIIKGKEEFGGGWVCFEKKGGCKAKFAALDPKIISQPRGKVENPDIADTYNTVLKMAKKRAHVDATLTTTAASDVFTQDIEDFQGDPPSPPPTQKPVTAKPASSPEDELPASMQTDSERLRAAAKSGKTWIYDPMKCPDEGLRQDYVVQLLEGGAEKDKNGHFHSIRDLRIDEILVKRMSGHPGL